MKKIVTLALVAASALTLSACKTQPYLVDADNDSTKIVAALDYRDFEKAANTMVADMLASGALNKRDGSRYVMIVGRITNDTMQRIDTAQLSKKIRVQLMQSGKVAMTAISEDDNINQVRKMRSSAEVNQATVAKQGKILAPELSLSGSITQRDIKAGSDKRIEYIFSLSVVDLESGLTFWEGEVPVIKMTDKDEVIW
jgi:uncharacterized protein (TIGR02722 family)